MVLALAGAGLVVDASVDPEPAAAHTKCEWRYVRGITHYQTVQRYGHHGPFTQRLPVYGPVWTNVCGISHGHWYHVVVCAAAASVVFGATTTLSGVNPVVGTVAAIGTAVACERVLRWAHNY